MAELEKQSPPARNCPRCGARLPSHVPPDLCPRCLLKAGLAEPLGTGPSGTVALPAQEAGSRALPQPGEQLGHYAILRLLGEGGMGAVFEAEDLENGRHVALKALGQSLNSLEARERFFREGRLAASINHPNSVYVFGTEEIGGTPVIAMELVAGGTLQDKVQAKGPLPVGEAVDCILQIIAGLEAAQRIGILHRDIKPSNCFVDAEGAVKIGDFGLSISSAIRTEPALTANGIFLGTPAFCSPEQLRGDELNARADMYSVGATLFYLLTGHTPFEAKNTVQLLATVLEQRAPTPRKFRPNTPHGLARVVLRCLEKQPGERFKNYGELRAALAPYSSAAPTPATLSLRCLAGLIDRMFLSAAGLVVLWMARADFSTFLNASSYRSPEFLTIFLIMLLYYTLLEGRWGASLGKAICRLRVARPDRNAPGVARAFLRVLIFLVLPMAPVWLITGGDPARLFGFKSDLVRYLLSSSSTILLGLLFCTVRRHNGFAAIQDILTATRVIARPAQQARPVLDLHEDTLLDTEARPRVGPYHVLETLEQSAVGKWLIGFDPRLLRKVWIRTVAPGTAPVATRLRGLGRIGRLRWIAGRRTPDENWDAFEAVTGKPLVSLLPERQPWSRVRFWLMDLAREISVALKSNTLPAVLSLDRVWITGDNCAKLLDFPAPGMGDEEKGTGSDSLSAMPLSVHRYPEARSFLNQVAFAGLNGSRTVAAEAGRVALSVPLPIRARDFLVKLGASVSPEEIIATLKPLLESAAIVTRWRRAGVIFGCVAIPVLVAISMTFGLRMITTIQRSQPGVFQLKQLLAVRSDMRSLRAKSQPGPDDRAFAIYVASHFRQTITNAAAWSNTFALSMINGDNRKFAEQSVAGHSSPTPEEIEEAETALKPLIPKTDDFRVLREPSLPLVMGGVSLILYVAIPALLAALLFRGGLIFRGFGLAVVRADGAPASRLRIFWRSLVAWSPVLCMPVIYYFGMQHSPGKFWSALLPAAIMTGLAIASVALPRRGLQDRLAGTCLVPR